MVTVDSLAAELGVQAFEVAELVRSLMPIEQDIEDNIADKVRAIITARKPQAAEAPQTAQLAPEEPRGPTMAERVAAVPCPVENEEQAGDLREAHGLPRELAAPSLITDDIPSQE